MSTLHAAGRRLVAPVSVPAWLIALVIAAAFAVGVVALNSGSASSDQGGAAVRGAPALSPTTSCLDATGRGPGHC